MPIMRAINTVPGRLMVASRAGCRSTALTRLIILAILLTAPVRAEVMALDLTSAPALAGRSFGASGTAQKWIGHATLALDPADPHNAVIADLALAPREADGRVRAVTDVVILRPQHPNGTLVFEVVNRGHKLLASWTQDTDVAAGDRLEQADDAGTGFLLEQGYTVVWAGWQGDVAPGPNLVRLDAPAAPGVTGPSRDEFVLPPGPGPHRLRLAYPVADPATALLSVQAHADAPRQELGVATLDGADTVVVSPAPGQPAGAIYQLRYTATGARVMGVGLAAIRDVTAFLRQDGSAANPLASDGHSTVRRAIGFGISQSGRVLRDFLYYGMNEDERGRVVFDGAMPVIPGARRSFTNARFAQPGRNPGPQFDRLYPVLQFPFTYPVLDDPLTGRRDGILLRCRLSNTCPRIMQMDSEFEFWGSQASLVVTDPAGYAIDMPADVRLYLATGSPHGNAWNAVATRNAGCALPVNPHNSRPVIRALLVAMQDWVTDGREPPASRYPGVAQGTLGSLARAYPAIPALGYEGRFVRAVLTEQGPVPRVVAEYPLLVPLAGHDGNAVAGVRLPLIAAPRATYTGWNATAGVDAPQALCTQLGSVIPLPATEAAARAVNDPRPSLEALYPAPGSYEAAVRVVTDELVHSRLLLPADAEAALAQARSGTLAKLEP